MTDFQARSSRVGRAYEDQVLSWLVEKGFTITGRRLLDQAEAFGDLTIIVLPYMEVAA